MVTPKMTVLMPVYNAESFLREAIESILNQTFQEFEFLIIDDGSTDRSREIVRSYDDPRIRFVVNEKNLGISETLNKGIRLSTCELIARMDADDISNPFRLRKQYDYMLAHPHCALLSTWARVISHDNKFVRLERYRSQYYHYNLTFECWMYHPTVIFRRQPVTEVGMYSMPYSEDYDLFWKLSTRFEIGNLAEPLVSYRLSPTSLNTVLRKKEYDIANEENVLRNIRYYMGENFSVSKPVLECLRHNFRPILETNDLDAAIESLQVLGAITERIIARKGVNGDEKTIREAYFFKREFMITQLAQGFPVLEKFSFVARTRQWMILYDIFARSVQWRLQKVKTFLFSF
jgi:glycosyltransferase involved in cell wall biosynthesis